MRSTLEWESLIQTLNGTELSMLGGERSCALADDLYRFGDQRYCITNLKSINGQTITEVVSLLWAVDDGAARRAYLAEVESDDGKERSVPQALLPLHSNGTYDSILKLARYNSASGALESASYRIMSDGAFIHRCIETNERAYYFRKTESPSDSPYAVLVKLQGSGIRH